MVHLDGRTYVGYDLSQIGGSSQPILAEKEHMQLQFRTAQDSGLLLFTGKAVNLLNFHFMYSLDWVFLINTTFTNLPNNLSWKNILLSNFLVSPTLIFATATFPESHLDAAILSCEERSKTLTCCGEFIALRAGIELFH